MKKILGWTPAHQAIYAMVIMIAGVLFGYYVTKKEVKPRYSVAQNYLFASLREDVPELKILWDGEPIQNFYSTRIAIWNAGNDFIDSSLLYSKDPIRIIVPPSINLLSHKIDKKSRDNLEISTLTKKINAQTIILIDLDDGEAIEEGDGFSVKLYFTSDNPTDFEVKGRVKGISDGFTYVNWDSSFKSESWNMLDWQTLAFIIFGAVLYIGQLYLTRQVIVSSERVDEMKPYRLDDKYEELFTAHIGELAITSEEKESILNFNNEGLTLRFKKIYKGLLYGGVFLIILLIGIYIARKYTDWWTMSWVL